jgi:hypothetical protein
MHRATLTFLLQREPQDAKDKAKTLEKYGGNFDFYESLSIEFFSRYAVKLQKRITKQRRVGELDHNVVSMHIKQGMWAWEEDDDDEDLEEFNQETLDLPVERFTCIESNFLSILDHVRLKKYFDMNSDDEYLFERECIINMTMAVISILIDLDRVDDAVNLID